MELPCLLCPSPSNSIMPPELLRGWGLSPSVFPQHRLEFALFRMTLCWFSSPACHSQPGMKPGMRTTHSFGGIPIGPILRLPQAPQEWGCVHHPLIPWCPQSSRGDGDPLQSAGHIPPVQEKFELFRIRVLELVCQPGMVPGMRTVPASP